VESLTLTSLPDDLDDKSMVPRMPLLSHLKVVAAWPPFCPLQHVIPRIDLARFPKLIWLKLCGCAPRQFLEIFAGQTASVQRCVITGSLDFKNGSTNFFARISDGLCALIVTGGNFSEPVTCKFPELRSLKLVGGCDLHALKTLDCPHLERLFVSENGSYDLIAGSFVRTLVAKCTSTLTALLLDVSYTTVPLDFPKSTINALSWCEELQILGIYGPLRLTQKSLRVFGRTHTKLEAVMASYESSCQTPDAVPDDIQVRISASDRYIIGPNTDVGCRAISSPSPSQVCNLLILLLSISNRDGSATFKSRTRPLGAQNPASAAGCKRATSSVIWIRTSSSKTRIRTAILPILSV
jgi:hypothetical protein